jgi:hypothetical protein
MFVVFFGEVDRRPELAGYFNELAFLDAIDNQVDIVVPGFYCVPGRDLYSFFHAAGRYGESNFLVVFLVVTHLFYFRVHTDDSFYCDLSCHNRFSFRGVLERRLSEHEALAPEQPAGMRRADKSCQTVGFADERSELAFDAIWLSCFDGRSGKADRKGERL